MQLALGIVLGLAFALIAVVALGPSLSKATSWFLLLLGWFLLLLCILTCVLTAVDQRGVLQ
jgi:hypothetical protein